MKESLNSTQLTRVYLSLFLILLFIPLSACRSDQDKNAPVDIVMDRHQCAQCGMVVSNQQYATQMLNEKGKRLHFDDIGCSIEWSHRHPKAAIKGYWVMDSKTLKWLSAKTAFFETNQPNTPMGYGYAALAKPDKNTVTFDKITSEVIKKTDKRHR